MSVLTQSGAPGLGLGLGHRTIAMGPRTLNAFLPKRDAINPQHAPSVPLTFEKKYQIIIEMGTGVYGTVYKVKQKNSRSHPTSDTQLQ